MKISSLFVASVVLASSVLTAQAPDDKPIGKPFTPPTTPFTEQLPVAVPNSGVSLPSLVTPIHTAPADMGHEYGIWAAGDSYKVSFGGGMTFVPYLGAGYPQTQSLAWKTTSAKLGEIELIANTTAKPVQSPLRYEYQFGPVTEAYDVRADGLEQTFVLHQRPTAGPLVIRGVITSQMQAQNVGDAQQELVFRDHQGNALVTYGRAEAFDANGSRVPVTTSQVDGEITLTVPAVWMAQAVLPITVDPLLTRVQTAVWSTGTIADGEVRDVDIGRDDEATVDNVMVAYVRDASAVDSDTWARLCDDDFSGSSVVFSDITSTWSTTEVSCAFVGGANRWAVLLRRYFPNNPTRVSQLRCHVHDSGDATLLTNYGSLVPPTGFNDWRMDVGGSESFTSGSNAMVVFQREDNSAATPSNFFNTQLSDIHGSLLDVTTANGTFGATFAIKPSSVHDNERPSVNQVAEGGANYSWICVYQRFITGQNDEDWDLNGVRIDQSGVPASGTWVSDFAVSSPSQHQLGPIVEGQNGRYAVNFATVDVPSFNFKTTLITGKQIQVERFDWDDTSSSPSGDQAPVQIRNNSDRRWIASGLGFDTNDDSHWCLGFRAVSPGTPVVYYARIGYTGNKTEEDILYFTSGDTTTGVSCVYDNDNDTFLFTYGVDDGTSLHPVYGHELTYDQPVAVSTFGTSCSLANLSWQGTQQIGGEFGLARVTGAPSTALHIMLLATSTTNLPVVNPAIAPGCRLFVPAAGPGFLGSFPTAFGTTVIWPLSLPEFLGAQTLHFQDWYLDTSNLLLFSTERLSVPIIK